MQISEHDIRAEQAMIPGLSVDRAVRNVMDRRRLNNRDRRAGVCRSVNWLK